jgi:uncharacterized membrane protein YraQ (UPF0718 family)
MTLYIVAGLVLVVIGGFITVFIYGRQSGKNAQQNTDLKVIDETQDKQLEAANQPRDAESIADKLRKHEF